MRKMRDSGVEWIGQIPVDWKLSKIKQSSTKGFLYYFWCGG